MLVDYKESKKFQWFFVGAQEKIKRGLLYEKLIQRRKGESKYECSIIERKSWIRKV